MNAPLLQVSPNPEPDEVVVPSDLAGLLTLAGYLFVVQKISSDDPRPEIVVGQHENERGEPLYARAYILADAKSVDVYRGGGTASSKYDRNYFATFKTFQERFRQAVMLLLMGELD